METVNIVKDIPVLYISAKSFPQGVQEAFEKLHALVSNQDQRRYFGISHPDKNGKILYKACTEELSIGEAEKYSCDRFIIRKGKFYSLEIKNHMNDPQNMGAAFGKLLHQPGIDPQGYCLECYSKYMDPDVICMVGLKDELK